MKYGQISLTMRNPSDENTVDEEATLLSEGIMAELATLLGTTVGDENYGDTPLAVLAKEEPVEVEEQPMSAPTKNYVMPTPQTYSVEVVRAGVSEAEQFQVKDDFELGEE